MGENFGEGSPRLPGPEHIDSGVPPTAIIKEKKLTFEEASKYLNTLGKDESGSRYAYLMITATDQKLTDVSIVLNFKHILFLDLSGNYLTTEALQVLTEMPFLIFLKAERNKIESVALKPMYYLQVLDLNQNQIKEVGNINQPMLECLELNYNDIYTTHFDTAHLDNLKQLELRSNLLFDISGIYPTNIEKLYMAANKITTIISLEFSKLTNLQILHLRENSIQKLNGFSKNMVNLKYLNLRNNQISKLKEFKKLQCLPKLETLIVTGNPLPGAEIPQRGEDAGAVFAGEGGKIRDPLVIPLLVLLRNLKRINKTVITLEDKVEAEDIENDILESMLDDVSSSEEELGSTTTNLTSDYKPGTESERNYDEDEEKQSV